MEPERARPAIGRYIRIMKRGFGGFGILATLIVAAIVLLLAARAWRAAAPAAQQVLRPGSAAGVDDHGQTEAGEALRSGKLPGVEDMKRETDKHAAEVKKAAQSTND